MPDDDAPRMLLDDDIEQFAIAVDHHLRAQGQPATDDTALLLLMETGYTPEGAASLIIAGRQ